MSLLNPFSPLLRTPVYSAPAVGMLQIGSDIISHRYTIPKTQKYEWLGALLFAITFVFFIFSLSTFLFSMPARIAVAQSSVAAAAASNPEPFQNVAAFTMPPPLELHIASDGFIFIHSAKVVSINGTTLTVSASWGNADFTWLVRTNATTYGTHDYGTSFLNQEGKKISIADVQNGDLVSVTGTLDSTEKEPTLNAAAVRSLK